MQKDQNVKVLYLTILQTKTETSTLYLLLNKLYRLPNKCFNAYFGLRTELKWELRLTKLKFRCNFRTTSITWKDIIGDAYTVFYDFNWLILLWLDIFVFRLVYFQFQFCRCGSFIGCIGSKTYFQFLLIGFKSLHPFHFHREVTELNILF